MNIGDIISIRHYSGKTCLKSKILKIGKNDIVAKLTKDFASLNFLEGDPVVLGYEENNEVFMAGSSVIQIDPDSNFIMLNIEDKGSLKQQRIHERFPVSFYAQILSEDCNKNFVATVKNMSFDGLMINSKDDFPLRKRIEVLIYPTYQPIKMDDELDNTLISLKADIIRRNIMQNGFEYGLKIVYIDAHNQNLIRMYLQSLKSMQIKFLKDIK